jgi:hypothetical protein
LKVKEIYIDKREQYKYLEEHNISQIELIHEWGICGCCTVIAELKDNKQTIIIFKRFDGKVQSVNLKTLLNLQQAVLNSDCILPFKFINMDFKGGYGTYRGKQKFVYSYKYKEEYSLSDYIPSTESINNYLDFGLRLGGIYNIVIKETNIALSKEQLGKSIDKLKLLGKRLEMVDYNTYAVIEDKGNEKIISVYSMQKQILNKLNKNN